jgi:hypothetical protein
MSDAPRSRFWLKSRWLLFLVNVILLVINLTCLGLLASAWRLAHQNETAQTSEAASRVGMKVGYINSPLVVFVDKDFPRTDKFQIYDARQKLFMSGEDGDEDDDKGARRYVVMALGLDFDISCYYSLDEGIRVRELRLTRQDEWLVDFNVDGFFDQRAPRDLTHPPDRLPVTQVWYKGRAGAHFRGFGLARLT